MPRTWLRKWEGGRVAKLSRERSRWVLEREWQGRTWTFPLRVASEDAAVLELRAWRADPAAYVSEAEKRAKKHLLAASAPVRLTDSLLDDLAKDLRRRQRTERHVRNTRAYCSVWAQDLGRANLRHLTRAELVRCLARHETARPKRIIALKTLTAYLRAQGLLEPAEDPGRHLQVPPPRPERAVRAKGYSAADLAKVYSALESQPTRDVMRLQVLYGMHGTEVTRVAQGLAVIKRLEGHGPIAGTLAFPHKTGAPHVISLEWHGLLAAERLASTSYAPWDSCVRKHLRRACAGLGLPSMLPGQWRHSFVTLAQGGRWVYPAGQGVSLADIAEVTGHRSAATTQRYYNGAAVPRMLVLPVALFHVDDPGRLRALG
jgi:integrase